METDDHYRICMQFRGIVLPLVFLLSISHLSNACREHALKPDLYTDLEDNLQPQNWPEAQYLSVEVQSSRGVCPTIH